MDNTSQLPASAEVDVRELSRLEVIHLVVFMLGFFLSAASVLVGSATLALIGGPCLMLSAALSWWGLHVSLSGAVGRVFRAVLGPMPRVSFHARTATWLAIGLAITAWGAWRLERPRVQDEDLRLSANVSMLGALHAEHPAR